MKILKSESDNIRIDAAILNMLPENNFTRSKVQKMIEDGKIRVNSKPTKPSYKIRLNDIIEIDEMNENNILVSPEKIKLDIIFEDDYFLIINKPKGMLTHPTPKNNKNTLVGALLNYGCSLSNIQGDERQGIVHRLDKNTSGLIIAAKTNEAHLNLQKQIQTKTAKRKYLAVVYGNIEQDNGIIDKPLVHYMNKTVKMNVSDNGKEAITLYNVLKRYDGLTLLELELKTGRTHQIRAHLSSINHPVYGDTLYGAKGYRSKIHLKTKEQLLMSYYLCLKHPKTNDIMEFQLNEERYDEDFKRFFKIINTKE